MIAEEKTTGEMAMELGISNKTVEYHRASLMNRLGVFNCVGLAKVAIRLGMVTV